MTFIILTTFSLDLFNYVNVRESFILSKVKLKLKSKTGNLENIHDTNYG